MCENFQRVVPPCRGTFEWSSSRGHGIEQFDSKWDYWVERKGRYFHKSIANIEPELSKEMEAGDLDGMDRI